MIAKKPPIFLGVESNFAMEGLQGILLNLLSLDRFGFVVDSNCVRSHGATLQFQFIVFAVNCTNAKKIFILIKQ